MAIQGESDMTAGSGLSNWRNNLTWIDDDEDPDSDTDSKLSGSAIVDSVMKRLLSKHSHFKDNSYMPSGEFSLDSIRDHTLQEQDEENEDVQSPLAYYTSPSHNGYHDSGSNRPLQTSGGQTNNSSRSHQPRRNYENSQVGSNYPHVNRKKEALSPVPEFSSSGARVIELSDPSQNQFLGAGRPNPAYNPHRGGTGRTGLSSTRSDGFPHGFGKGGGPGTRSMENISHNTSPASRRRRNYEQTQIGVGGVPVTNGRPPYRDVRVPHPLANSGGGGGGGELSSFHSRSQEVLPLSAHFDNSIAARGTYNDSRDGSHSDVNVGYGVSHLRRSSAGSGSGIQPSSAAHGSRAPYQSHHAHTTQPPPVITISSSAPQKSWLTESQGFDSQTSSNQRMMSYNRHELPRDNSYHSNIHGETSGVRSTDDPVERSVSFPHSHFSGSHPKGNEPNLNDVVDFLSSEDPSLVSNAASYLQHLAYGDDSMKAKIRTFGAIPALVNQLRNPETKVQISVLGALRNLSFGRANDENKVTIAGEHGLAEILLALKMSRVSEVRDLLTSLLWNLSSCEGLKLRIIKSSIHDLVELALIPYSGWSHEAVRDPLAKPSIVQWNLELRNITGTLRNVSSAGETSRVFMRSSNGLVDSLIWILKAGVQQKTAADEKTVENAACVLRNLSYRLEIEVDPQEGAGEVLDHEWEEEQRRDMMESNRSISKSSPGCLAFLSMTRDTSSKDSGTVQSPLANRFTYSVDFANPDPSSLPKRQRPVYGSALLWQPEIVYVYLALIEHYSGAVETVEASAGAIQNITACNWKWAVYSRNVIRTSNGLRLLVELLNNGHDAIVKAAAMALRNLTIDPRSKAAFGSQVISSVIPRLPFGSNHLGVSEETSVALLCCLMEVCTESSPNSRIFITSDGIPSLTRLSRSRQHTQKINFAAGKLCSILYEYKDCKTALKREGWEMSVFQRMVKENSNQFDFEQRVSISRDYQGSRRKKRKKGSKKSKGRGNGEEDKGAGGVKLKEISATPSLASSVSPSHVPKPRPLPPATGEQYPIEAGYQTISQSQSGGPPIIYQSIDDPDLQGAMSSAPAPQPPLPRTETAASTTSAPLSTSGPLSANSQEESEPDPNATYASVDIEKKRASRREKEREKNEKERKAKEQADADSWV